MTAKKKTHKAKNKSTNTLSTDFRAEVIVSGLVNAGKDIERTLIIRQRGNIRDVSKDINKIEYQYSNHDLMEYLYIYTNRYSIYDSLPEGIFHQPQQSKRVKTHEDVIQEIRKHRNEEYFARKYFQPFEIVIDQLLVDAQAYEQQFDKAHFYNNLKEIFKDQWSILKHLSLNQALLFIKIIPVIAEISQSLELIAQVMSIILDCPIEVKEGKKSQQCLAKDKMIILGKWRLGINSILGNRVDSENPDLEIIIGPMGTEKMKLFETGATNYLILNELVDLMMPFDRNINIKYRISRTDTKFRLSSPGHRAYLGINTRI